MENLLRYIGERSGSNSFASGIEVASVSGRYYAMDRDRRWNRTELAYRAIVDGTGPMASGPREAIVTAYDAHVTDEFILPVTIVREGAAVAPMRDGDAVICFNYRSDRMRQIVRALIEPGFDGFDVARQPKVSVTTLTVYDRKFSIPAAFAPQSMERIPPRFSQTTGVRC